MAACQPSCREPGAAQRPMARERLVGVGRARGCEAATGWQQWGEHQLVCPHRRHERAARKETQVHGSPGRARGVAPTQDLGTQSVVGGSIGLATGAHQQVARRLHRLHLTPPYFLEPAPETIAGHRSRLKSGNDQPHARMAQSIVNPDQVEKRGPAAPTLGQAPPDVGRSRQSARPRESLAGGQARPCFDGMETVNRFRPFFRRRDRTSRPQRSAIRARNPCLAMRFLLRGRYVGIIRLTVLQ